MLLLFTLFVPNAAPQGTGGGAAATAQIRVVDVTQRGVPPTGPHPIVIEHDQRLATHTIYRPATLGPTKHPVLVWGEGGCAKNGLTFPEYLSEIASYGFSRSHCCRGCNARPAGRQRATPSGSTESNYRLRESGLRGNKKTA